MERLYYLGWWTDDNLYCLCKDGDWLPYRECEENWDNVVVLPRKEIYARKDEESSCGIDIEKLDVRSNESQRMLFYHLSFDDDRDCWKLISKTIAESFWAACREFGVNSDEGFGSFRDRVIHHSDLQRYELGED